MFHDGPITKAQLHPPSSPNRIEFSLASRQPLETLAPSIPPPPRSDLAIPAAVAAMASGGNPNPTGAPSQPCPPHPQQQQPPPGGSPATPMNYLRPPSIAGSPFQGLFHTPPHHNPAF
ncbi:hypothetical protein BAE44_0025047 [Dichanthelium oligosanthes]|uniref:Uncharacterized protein n=1 Tax=Dichanthelium oligosanthes TaxID=888268 RepID=A0A1E5UMC5_9POAL|nr:hypothetical protein BAE44_0025047 [Dichanthelium oligosanthes]